MMLDRPLDVPEEQATEARTRRDDLRDRLEDHVANMLDEIQDQTLAEQLNLVVFSDSNALPKRKAGRSSHIIHYVVEHCYRGMGGDDSSLDSLLRSTLVLNEYFDIVDDFIDGDVAPGHELEVYVTNELLNSVLVRQLAPLGPDAISYWAEGMLRTAGSFVTELSNQPDVDTYRRLVDRQAELGGTLTGTAAIVADGSEEVIDDAARIGRACFRYEQFVRDYEQYHGDDDDPWNLFAMGPEAAGVEAIREQRETLLESIEFLPEDRRRLLEPVVAIDLESLRGETI